MPTFILPLAIGILLVISSLLAASETAIFALIRMEHTRERLPTKVRAAVEQLMRHPVESLIVIIGLNETVNVFAECLTTIMLIAWLGRVGAIVSVPLMLIVVLVFCDITPKTFALGYPSGIAAITARVLASLAEAVMPAVRFVAPLSQAPELEPVSESEFKVLLHMGEEQGEIEPGERVLIHKVFDFGNRRVAEVMTPRERMFELDMAQPLEKLTAAVIQSHFSRVPIYRGNPQNIVGILHTKDLVARRIDPSPPRIERIIRRPYFVPPAKPLGELFNEMRRGHFQMAIVVDEYGNVRGLITLEDMLEELFGELRDEFDIEEPEITPVGDNEWVVSGAIEVERLSQALDGGHPASLGGGPGHTLSTLVLRRLGRVPRAGERFRLGDFDAAVERVRGAVIELVRLKR